MQLIATHGRDNPFGNPLVMGEQFEKALRFGLERVGAQYARTIPFDFAFYGDLWRPDSRAEWEEPRNGSTRGADLESRTDIEIALAEEVLENAGVLAPGEKGFWDSLAQVVGVLQEHMPGAVGQDLLERFAKDTAEYFTHDRLRELTINRVGDQVRAAGGEVVLLAHSMGTIVVYDLLVRQPDLPVRAFISFGSPLGMRTVMENVGGDRESAPFPPGLPRWINVYNQEDLVASVRTLAPLYLSDDGRKVEDLDTGKMRSPGILDLFSGHDPDDYLSSKVMANAVASVVDSQ